MFAAFRLIVLTIFDLHRASGEGGTQEGHNAYENDKRHHLGAHPAARFGPLRPL